MRIIASFLCYTGYLNYIKDSLSHVVLLIRAHVLLLSRLYVLTSCISVIKNHVKDIVKQFMRGTVKIYFGLLEIQVRFFISLNLFELRVKLTHV